MQDCSVDVLFSFLADTVSIESLFQFKKRKEGAVFSGLFFFTMYIIMFVFLKLGHTR